MDAAAARRHSPSLFPVAVVVALAAAGTGSAADDRRAVAPAFDDGRLDRPVADRRMYATGMVGSTVGQSAAGATGPLVAGQGACGVSVPRAIGDMRLELEARRRQPLAGGGKPAGVTTGAAPSPALAEEWTTMANVWRDLPLTSHLGVYAGGGIGVGMRRSLPADAASRSGLGWQAGAGITYAATDRVTFDAGYRFSGLEAAGPRMTAPASELLFAVRIHEPFRGLRRDGGR